MEEEGLMRLTPELQHPEYGNRLPNDFSDAVSVFSFHDAMDRDAEEEILHHEHPHNNHNHNNNHHHHHNNHHYHNQQHSHHHPHRDVSSKNDSDSHLKEESSNRTSSINDTSSGFYSNNANDSDDFLGSPIGSGSVSPDLSPAMTGSDFGGFDDNEENVTDSLDFESECSLEDFDDDGVDGESGENEDEQSAIINDRKSFGATDRVCVVSLLTQPSLHLSPDALISSSSAQITNSFELRSTCQKMKKIIRQSAAPSGKFLQNTPVQSFTSALLPNGLGMPGACARAEGVRAAQISALKLVRCLVASGESFAPVVISSNLLHLPFAILQSTASDLTDELKTSKDNKSNELSTNSQQTHNRKSNSCNGGAVVALALGSLLAAALVPLLAAHIKQNYLNELKWLVNTFKATGYRANPGVVLEKLMNRLLKPPASTVASSTYSSVMPPRMSVRPVNLTYGSSPLLTRSVTPPLTGQPKHNFRLWMPSSDRKVNQYDNSTTHQKQQQLHSGDLNKEESSSGINSSGSSAGTGEINSPVSSALPTDVSFGGGGGGGGNSTGELLGQPHQSSFTFDHTPSSSSSLLHKHQQQSPSLAPQQPSSRSAHGWLTNILQTRRLSSDNQSSSSSPTLSASSTSPSASPVMKSDMKNTSAAKPYVHRRVDVSKIISTIKSAENASVEEFDERYQEQQEEAFTDDEDIFSSDDVDSDAPPDAEQFYDSDPEL